MVQDLNFSFQLVCIVYNAHSFAIENEEYVKYTSFLFWEKFKLFQMLICRNLLVTLDTKPLSSCDWGAGSLFATACLNFHINWTLKRYNSKMVCTGCLLSQSYLVPWEDSTELHLQFRVLSSLLHDQPLILSVCWEQMLLSKKDPHS